MEHSTKSTTDYKIFKFLKQNRKINPFLVKHIERSISAQNDLHAFPIIVDAEFNVIDGQHRLKAAMNLGVRVWYVVNENANDDFMIRTNNNRGNWSQEDYLNHFIGRGYPEYIKLKKFMDQHEISLSEALIWLSVGASRKRNFNQGMGVFKIDALTLDALLYCRELGRYLVNTKKLLPRNLKNKAFVKACKSFFKSQFIDSKEFMDKKVKNYGHAKLEKEHSYQGYLKMFVDLYNYNRRGNLVRISESGLRRRSLVIERD